MSIRFSGRILSHSRYPGTDFFALPTVHRRIITHSYLPVCGWHFKFHACGGEQRLYGRDVHYSGTHVVIEDRRAAIKYALENAKEKDVIVLAGKGHENYQEIGGGKRHFDEKEIVAELLEELDRR